MFSLSSIGIAHLPSNPEINNFEVLLGPTIIVKVKYGIGSTRCRSRPAPCDVTDLELDLPLNYNLRIIEQLIYRILDVIEGDRRSTEVEEMSGNRTVGRAQNSLHCSVIILPFVR